MQSTESFSKFESEDSINPERSRASPFSISTKLSSFSEGCPKTPEYSFSIPPISVMSPPEFSSLLMKVRSIS